jgi:hypothetical protein
MLVCYELPQTSSETVVLLLDCCPWWDGVGGSTLNHPGTSGGRPGLETCSQGASCKCAWEPGLCYAGLATPPLQASLLAWGQNCPSSHDKCWISYFIISSLLGAILFTSSPPKQTLFYYYFPTQKRLCKYCKYREACRVKIHISHFVSNQFHFPPWISAVFSLVIRFSDQWADVHTCA